MYSTGLGYTIDAGAPPLLMYSIFEVDEEGGRINRSN
jgi:hypothetical protein